MNSYQQNVCPCCNQNRNTENYSSRTNHYPPNSYSGSIENYTARNNYYNPYNNPRNNPINNNYYGSRENYHTPSEKESIVLLYADWCGHCKTYKASGGDWDTLKAANSDKYNFYEVKEKDFSNVLESIRSLVQNYSIKGFPTVLKVSNGKVSEVNRKTLM